MFEGYKSDMQVGHRQSHASLRGPGSTSECRHEWLQRRPTPQRKSLRSTSWPTKNGTIPVTSALYNFFSSMCILIPTKSIAASTAQVKGQSWRSCSWLLSADWMTHWTCKMLRWCSRDSWGRWLLTGYPSPVSLAFLDSLERFLARLVDRHCLLVVYHVAILDRLTKYINSRLGPGA